MAPPTRRHPAWLLLAALLLLASAGLLALVEEPPARPAAQVAFPRRMREVERRRQDGRRTLPSAPAAAPEAAGPPRPDAPAAAPPGRDPFLTALPVAPGEPLVIFEANALRHSRLGELFIRCAMARDPRFFDELAAQSGLDVLKDVDRVGFAGPTVVVSGTFGKARWERLEAEADVEPYGQEGRLYRDRGRAGAPVLARWRDQVVVLAPDAAGARRAVDQLEGRAAAPPALDEALAYGEVYGLIPGEAVGRLFPARDRELGARLAAAASRVELHVDAMQDVAAVVRVQGADQAALSDLARSLGGLVAAGRLQAQASGDGRLAELLDAARVVPEDGRFSLELAVPAATLERWFDGCAGASAPAAR